MAINLNMEAFRYAATLADQLGLEMAIARRSRW